MITGRVIRSVLVLGAAALLGGCFYSEEALISWRQADFPIERGTYSHTPYHPDGRPFDRPTWEGEIRRSGRAYASEAANFPHEGVRLRELSPGLYAAMKPDEEFFLYGLVTVYPDGIVTYHQPRCDELEAADLTRYDVEEHAEEPGFCRIDDWDRLHGVLLTYLGAMDGNLPIDGVYRRLAD